MKINIKKNSLTLDEVAEEYGLPLTTENAAVIVAAAKECLPDHEDAEHWTKEEAEKVLQYISDIEESNDPNVPSWFWAMKAPEEYDFTRYDFTRNPDKTKLANLERLLFHRQNETTFWNMQNDYLSKLGVLSLDEIAGFLERPTALVVEIAKGILPYHEDPEFWTNDEAAAIIKTYLSIYGKDGLDVIDVGSYKEVPLWIKIELHLGLYDYTRYEATFNKERSDAAYDRYCEYKKQGKNAWGEADAAYRAAFLGDYKNPCLSKLYKFLDEHSGIFPRGNA